MLRKSSNIFQWPIAVFLSVVLWVISIEDRTFEVTIRLPVSRPPLSSDLIVLDEAESDSVTVVFEGAGFEVLLDQLTRKPEAVRLRLPVIDQGRDLPATVSGEFTGDDIMFHNGPYSRLAARSFVPGSVSLTIDRTVVRDLPVAVMTDSDMPERYFWRNTDQATVEVRGARSVVSRLDSLYTEPVPPGSGPSAVAIVKPEGVTYISPSTVTVELVPPVQVISPLHRRHVY